MRQSWLCGVCQFLVGVIVAALVIHVWFIMGLVAPVIIEGSSMSPTLNESQRTLVDRTAFSFRQPRRWEIVVFRSPEDAAQLCVKRVAGLPRETVSLVGGNVLIDGQRIANPRGVSYEIRYGDNSKLQTGWRLGPHEYFVLGDNGAISDDSRNWLSGPGVDAKLLVGRPLGVR